MQKLKKRSPTPPHDVLPSPLVLEIKKCEGGAVASVTGVVSIGELSDRFISLATHSGRVGVRGTALTLTAFANRTVEVKGRVEGVDLGYGGN
jgi:hypothetical protein